MAKKEKDELKYGKPTAGAITETDAMVVRPESTERPSQAELAGRRASSFIRNTQGALERKALSTGAGIISGVAAAVKPFSDFKRGLTGAQPQANATQAQTNIEPANNQTGNEGAPPNNVIAQPSIRRTPVYDNAYIANRPDLASMKDPAQPAIPQATTQLSRVNPTQIADATVAKQGGVARRAIAQASSGLRGGSRKAELMRRIEMAQSALSHRGSPQARQALTNALLMQMGGIQNAEQQLQTASNATLSGVAGNEVANAQNENAAILGRDAQNANAAFQNAQLERAGTPIVGQDGNMSLLQGAKATQITGPDGKPFRGQPAGVNPEIVKAYNESFNTLLEQAGGVPDDPEQAQALMQNINASLAQNPTFASLYGQQSQRQTPSLELFMSKAKEKNPNMMDDQLKMKYNELYGN